MAVLFTLVTLHIRLVFVSRPSIVSISISVVDATSTILACHVSLFLAALTFNMPQLSTVVAFYV